MTLPHQAQNDQKELLQQTSILTALEDEILFHLKDLAGFKKFIHFNNVDDESIRQVIHFSIRR